MDRRHYLLTAGSTLLVATAGCTEGDSFTDNESDNESDNETDDNESDGSDGQGDTTDGDDGDMDGDDGEDGTDGTDGDTDGDDSTDGTDGSGLPTFDSVASVTDEYVIEIDLDDPSQNLTGSFTGRYKGENYYAHFVDDGSGTEWEVYSIDGDTYVVTGGECIKNPGSQAEPSVEIDTSVDEYEEQLPGDLQATGTTQINGEEAYIYETSFPQGVGDATLYISVESGYPLRMEADIGVFKYSNWDNVEPITEPDANCIEY
jgi:hypothetical protein